MTDQISLDASAGEKKPEIEPPNISIQASAIAKINLALQQNAFPVIRDIEIKNDTARQLSDIELTVTSTPNFIIERTWPIDRLAAESQLIFDDSHIELNSEHLRKITESLGGLLLKTDIFVLLKYNEQTSLGTSRV